MSLVAVVKTSPEEVVESYAKCMELASFEKVVDKRHRCVIKINLSWSLFFPACSTPPWQLDAVLGFMRKKGYKDVVAVENQTVVTHPWKGAYLNKWLPVLEKHSVEYVPLTNVEWVPYKPKHELLAMHEIFGDRILVPKMFMNTNMVHLPTMKTHGHTITTGAMKNAFGGLIPKYRHHAHLKIHEVLVDLLIIQKEIHKSVFAVMDGCVCGNGAGPRTMEPYYGNLVLASEDQVAIDALAAHIIGFDPFKIPYIKMAHELGLGNADVEQIDIVGMDKRDVLKLNFGFEVKKSPVIAWDQRLRKGTYRIKWLHNLLFHSPIFKLFIMASEVYHDRIWYPIIGKRRIKEFLKTEWGKLFQQYPYGSYPSYDEVRDWDPY